MVANSLTEQMVRAAADAETLTDIYFSKQLDYSEDSIGVLENLVDDIHYRLPDGKSQKNINLLCQIWGAYIGEVFRRNIGGEWINWEDEYGKAIAFQSSGVKVFPSDKVHKRIVNGAEHNLYDYYYTQA